MFRLIIKMVINPISTKFLIHINNFKIVFGFERIKSTKERKKQDDGRELPKASSYKISNVSSPQQTHAPVIVGDDQLPF